MGGQLTKEQARLPFGYVSVKNHRRRITPSTIKPNVHPSPDASESLMSELAELNNHLQNINSSHLTLITPTGETASIITTGTDAISPEVLMELDKPEDDSQWQLSHSHSGDDRSCFHRTTEDLEAHGGLSPIVFSELPNLKNIGLCSLGLVKLSPNICFLYITNCLQM
jgi:hypothetical protein